MRVKLYLDEDSSDVDLLRALRLRGVDVVGAQESGMRGRTDPEQLHWAADQQRALYTANVAHFYRLHSELIRAGRDHYGIIMNVRQRYSVGEQMNRLLRLMSQLTADRLKYSQAASVVGKEGATSDKLTIEVRTPCVR